MEKKKHFVLVHGASHGAWCWYKLVPLLKLAGHHVTALDLGASGVNPKQLDELESISDYVQPLMEFMASLPQHERVILVGHSYGGFALSLAMENFPEKIWVAVFVSSFMPNYTDPPATQVQEYLKRLSEESVLDSQFKFDRGQENPPTSVSLGPKYLETIMYKNCLPEASTQSTGKVKSSHGCSIMAFDDIELARVLIRPHKFFLEDLAKESLLSKAKFGSVERVFVVCKEDGVFGEEIQQWIIENSPTKEVKFIEGAAHMVMLSKPKDICLCLEEIAEKYL
ncbi:unnamed protein product [Dovyalis caffra]|uniref:(S)-hydroxynitrile lyase n=1 Tax=Dovyalis caffra TaxID=77055 RepID=A0AAV1RSX5_9ROSI|nr:unnamed protein product [Dovyalis caffra]